MLFSERILLYKITLPQEFYRWMEFKECRREHVSDTEEAIISRPELRQWVRYVDLLTDYLNSKLVWVISYYPVVYSKILDLMQAMLFSIDETGNSWDGIIKYLDINYLIQNGLNMSEFKIFRDLLPDTFCYNWFWKKEIIGFYRNYYDEIASYKQKQDFIGDLTQWHGPIIINQNKWTLEASWTFSSDIDQYLIQFNDKAKALGLLPLDLKNLQESFLKKKKVKVEKDLILSATDRVLHNCIEKINKAKWKNKASTYITLAIYDTVIELNDKIHEEGITIALNKIIKDNIWYLIKYYSVFEKSKKNPKYDIETLIIGFLSVEGDFLEAEQYIESACLYYRIYFGSVMSWVSMRVFEKKVSSFNIELIEWSNFTPEYVSFYLFQRIFYLFRDWFSYEGLSQIVDDVSALQDRVNYKVTEQSSVFLSASRWLLDAEDGEKIKFLEAFCDEYVKMIKGRLFKEPETIKQGISFLLKWIHESFWDEANSVFYKHYNSLGVDK